ncbi:MAG: hypothetical protein U1E53_10815 [Dongiaceae bacterium]
MRRIAIGPVRPLPSWQWVGEGTAAALAAHYEVVPFAGLARPPAADLLLLVKQRPPEAFLAAARAAGTRIVFLPIDRYESAAALLADAAFLAGCDLVLSHSEALLPLLRPHCRRLGHVEHHGRDVLAEPAAWHAAGYVLWVGGLQHLPHLLRRLERNPLPAPLRLLTDLDNPRARDAAGAVARRLGVALAVADGAINGHAALAWEPERQRRMMAECRAAIDIKGDDFAQRTKPPTKGQQFVASGIPFACNPDSATAAWFRARGFAVADPDDPARWLSPAYWEETARFAAQLRPQLAPEAVGAVYRGWIERLLGPA